MKSGYVKWLPSHFGEIIEKFGSKFTGKALEPVDNPYGTGERWWKEHKSDFNNRGEQVVYFVTSGSTGYMQDGVYWDISGAEISEKEYNEIIVALGIQELLPRESTRKLGE
jgi:hypothetical protein